jgi:hypothetical protein
LKIKINFIYQDGEVTPPFHCNVHCAAMVESLQQFSFLITRIDFIDHHPWELPMDALSSLVRNNLQSLQIRQLSVAGHGNEVAFFAGGNWAGLQKVHLPVFLGESIFLLPSS